MPIPKPQSGEKQNDFISRCMGDSAMNDEYPENDQRAAICHGQWKEVKTQEENMEHYGLLAQNYTIREETLGGKKHFVLPVVMMTSGVHAGSHGPLFHDAAELGRFPASWDGIPVAIQHPVDNDGTPVSCNQPSVLDKQVVGRVFNTHLDDGKLRAEVWIDPELISRIAPEALAHLKKGKPMDVSVGVFTEDDMVAGEWNGESYIGIARNHRPDHLALLPGATGACSWNDGCGVRANQEGMQTNAIKFDGTESTPWSKPNLADFGLSGQWQTLSQEDKATVAGHFLIGDDAAANYGELMFPVVNPKTGKLNEAALRAVIGGRGAQANITAAQRISARRQAYRLLNDEFDAELEVPKVLEFVANGEHPDVKELAAEGFSITINEMSHQDMAGQIQAKLDRMDSDTKVHFLVECYDDYFIYQVRPKGGDQPSPMADGDTFRRDYEIKDDKIEFTGEAIPVVKKTEYVNINEGGHKMPNNNKQPCCEEKVQMLIEAGLYSEDHRERLLAMEEADIDILMTSTEKKAELKAKIDELQGKLDAMQANADQATTKQEAIQVLKDDLGDKDKFLALAPPEIRAVFQHGLGLYHQERARKIGHILANTDVYTKDRLEAMQDQDLDDLARAIKVPTDFSLNGPVPQVNRGGHESQAVYPPGVE